MSVGGPAISRRIAQVLLFGAGCAGVLAIWAAVTGGFRVYVLGVPLSVRGADRAAYVSMVCGAVAVWLDGRLNQRLLGWLDRLPPAVFHAVAILSMATVLWVGFAFGTKAAGGSDSYAYVSLAKLWQAGKLRVEQPFVQGTPWPDPDWAFAPLGYRPAEGHTLVPVVAPGISLLMAGLMTVFGDGAEYWLTPLCGAAVVLLTYLIGATVSRPAVGAIAAVCVATSPILLLMTCSLLGDLPGAAFWLLSVWLSLRGTLGGMTAAGIAAGVAILIRPNLVPLALVPLFIGSCRPFGTSVASSLRRAAAFGLASAPAALFIGWLFNELYGSPLNSGYGDTDGLYSLDHVARNLRQYSGWILESQGPLVFLFPLSVVVAIRTGVDWSLRAAMTAFIGLVLACYIAYLPFDAWWFVRFLLPAIPVMFILSADAALNATRALGAERRRVVVLGFVVLTAGYGLRESLRRDEVLSTRSSEQRYAVVGQFVKVHLPTNAIVYSVQHSGSIRLYSGRLTVRWDNIDSEWLDRSIEYLRHRGYEPFVVLERWELPRFLEKFPTQAAARALTTEPKREPFTYDILVYHLDDQSDDGFPRRVPLPRPTPKAR